jgi:hypothetical protein
MVILYLLFIYISYIHVYIYICIKHYVSRGGAVGIATGHGWTTEGSEFESRQGQEFSLLHVVQTGSAAHPALYPMGTRGSFPGGKAAGA